MSPSEKKTARKRSGRIPFGALFTDEAGKRRVRMALQQPGTFRPGVRAELERYLADPLKATVKDMGQLLDERAAFRGGRAAGTLSATTQYIHKLATDHPTLAAKELRKKADLAKIGSMSDGTFRNKVRKARNK